MRQISRRNFVKGMGALPLALALPRIAGATEPLLRCDLATSHGREMLAVLAGAIRKCRNTFVAPMPG